jgi:hypothetical protein
MMFAIEIRGLLLLQMIQNRKRTQEKVGWFWFQ